MHLFINFYFLNDKESKYQLGKYIIEIHFV